MVVVMLEGVISRNGFPFCSSWLEALDFRKSPFFCVHRRQSEPWMQKDNRTYTTTRIWPKTGIALEVYPPTHTHKNLVSSRL
jgi:hypothetical protein